MAVLDRYLKFAVQSNASDLHLSLNREITVRLHGTLRRIQGPKLSTEQKTGKSALNTFAQLAAFFKPEPPPVPPESVETPKREEPPPSTPPEGGGSASS